MLGFRRQLAFAVLALVLCSGCSTLTFSSADALMEQGIELYNEGRYAEAVLRFEKVIQRDPQRYLAYVFLARALLGQSHWGPAIQYAQQAHALSPNSGEAASVLGEALLGGGVDALRQGDFADAVSRLASYVRLKPTDGDGYARLAEAHFGAGSYRDAARVLIQGLGAVPGGPARHPLLQQLLSGGTRALAQGQPDAAAQMLAAYVREEPGNPSAFLDLARAYLQSGEPLDALGAFRRVLELSPDNAEARRFLGGTR